MVPANQWQDRTAVRWELNIAAGFGDWLDPLEYVQWLFEDPALLCAVPCRVCWWKASFWRCLSLWIVVTWLFVVLCCLRLSVFFSYHSALVLVFFSVFLLVYPFQDDDVYCPVQSSLRLFVRPMYDLSIVCTTTVNNSRDDLQCRNMCGQTDSCLVTDPDPIVRWHGTSFQNTIRVSRRVCVCSHPSSLFPSFKNTYSHIHGVPVPVPANAWMNVMTACVVWYDRQSIDDQWRCVGLCRIVACSSVKNRYSSVVSCVTDSFCACIVLSLHSLIVVPTNNTLTRLTIFIFFPCSSLPFFFFSGAIFFCHAPIHPYVLSFARTIQDKTLYTYTAGVNGNTTTSRYTPLGPRSSLTGMEGREWIIATIA